MKWALAFSLPTFLFPTFCFLLQSMSSTLSINYLKAALMKTGSIFCQRFLLVRLELNKKNEI